MLSLRCCPDLISFIDMCCRLFHVPENLLSNLQVEKLKTKHGFIHQFQIEKDVFVCMCFDHTSTHLCYCVLDRQWNVCLYICAQGRKTERHWKKKTEREVMVIRGGDEGRDLRQEHWGDITWQNTPRTSIKALAERQRFGLPISSPSSLLIRGRVRTALVSDRIHNIKHSCI